jgi:hypothetical protein
MAFTAIAGLGLMSTAMGLYTYARKHNPWGSTRARLSPAAALVSMAGGVATMVYAATFRIHDLATERPFNPGDILGAPPVLLFVLAGILLIRDVGRAVGRARPEE